jgi:hypothetical protein
MGKTKRRHLPDDPEELRAAIDAMVKQRDLRRQNGRGPSPAEKRRAERQERTAAMLGRQIAARSLESVWAELSDWGSSAVSELQLEGDQLD